MPASASRDRASPTAEDFGRAVRRLAFTWIALLVLMGLSLGSAFVGLGTANFAVSFAIAVIKAALVVWTFMELRRAPPVTRMAAMAGLLFLALLMGLSGFDYATRNVAPAPWQVPLQLESSLGERR